VKVLDFGLAKLIDPLPLPLDVAGSSPRRRSLARDASSAPVAYMSPEQAEGKSIGSRSDLFSFAVLLYDLATGERPFAGDTTVSIRATILQKEPRKVVEEREQVHVSDVEDFLDASRRVDPQTS
jgi:serine/threonine protein kinase